ncbi:hypothetical protein VPH35_083670 [Triticum aestivum]
MVFLLDMRLRTRCRRAMYVCLQEEDTGNTTCSSCLGYERDDAVHEPLGVVAMELPKEEHVALPLQLQPSRPPAPPARGHGLVVRAVARGQPVLEPRGHQHPRAREPLQRRRRQRVHPRVVRAAHRRPAARVGPEEPGHPGRGRGLPLDRRVPAEPRVQQYRALDPRSAVPHEHLVRDVGAGAVPRDEQLRGVAVVGDPAVLRRGSPPERGPGVVVGGGERVLRGEAVVDGHREDAGRGGERVEVVVVRGVAGRPDEEGAAVEVDDDRELRGGVLELVGEVEAHGEARARVEDDVLGGDAGGLVDAGGQDGGVVEAVYLPAPVDAEAPRRL